MEAVHLELTHNPYTVTTQLAQVCHGEKTYISEMHALSPILHDRLIWWVNPHDDWPGFFALLPSAFPGDRYVIRFHGLPQDYDRLVEAYELQKEQLSLRVSFVFTGEGLEAHHSPEAKLKKMRVWRSTLEETGSPAVRDPEIREAFDSLFNGELEIITSAPVNAGKSTLQNAIIGMRLLPTSSRAKTSVPTRVRLDQNLDAFTLQIRTGEGTEDEPSVTRRRVEQLNDTLSAGEEAQQQPVICLEGPLVRCPSDSGLLDRGSIKPVFTDCPGINNANNASHKTITQQFLKHKNMNLVLFVFNPKTLDHRDTMEALTDTLDSVCEGILSTRNKVLLQDHVIFVCNQADKYSEDYDGLFFAIKSMLASRGILMPKLHLVCARSAELIRTRNRNRELIAQGRREEADLLTRTEADELDHLVRRFTGHREGAEEETDALYRYSTLSQLEKAPMASRTALLRGENTPDADAEMALLHSGVPGLEQLLTRYLDCCALPIKLRVFRDQVVTKYNELSNKAWEELHALQTEAEEIAAVLPHYKVLLEDMNRFHDRMGKRSNYEWKETTLNHWRDEFTNQVYDIKNHISFGKIRDKITYADFSNISNVLIGQFRSVLEQKITRDYEEARLVREGWNQICKSYSLLVDSGISDAGWDEIFDRNIPPIQTDPFSWDFRMQVYRCSNWVDYRITLHLELAKFVQQYYEYHIEILKQNTNKSLDRLWPYIEKHTKLLGDLIHEKSREQTEKQQRYAQLQMEITKKILMVNETTRFFTDVISLLDLPLPPVRQEESHDTHLSETEF